MNTRIIYRLADRGDLGELARLRWNFHAEDEGEPKESLQEFTERIAESAGAGLDAGRWFIWVADTSEGLVSAMWIEVVEKVPRPDGSGDSGGAWGYLTNVYTEPLLRDSGIGSKLLQMAKEWAFMKGLELLIVWPSEASVEFYRRAGFSENPMLFELSLQGAEPRPSRRVEVVEADPNWPHQFEEEKALILGALGELVGSVEHVGSTSVPGLGAKPIIDIMVGLGRLSDFKQCVIPLEDLGYEYAPWVEAELPERRYFRKKTNGVRSHHLHMVEQSSDFFFRHLLFRDWLRTHPKDADEYFLLKKRLALEHEWDTIGYTEAKTQFVASVLRRAEAALES